MVRGEVELRIDGKAHSLCLTLGALAQIEAALGLADFSELDVRLQKINATDVIAILGALLAGGGNPMEADHLRNAKLDPAEVAGAIASVFASAGTSDEAN